jgi:PKHD-type hydroxylase
MLKIDNFLSKTECETIINMGCDNWLPSLSDKGIILEKYRKSKHISPNIHKGEWLYDITKRCFLKHNIEITADVLKEVQILKYEVGDYIVKHHDTMGYDTNGDTLNRYYALNIILNDDFEGGDFFIQTSKDKIYPPQKAGTVLVFPSFLIHGVEPVTKGVRRSVVTWMVGPWFK